MINVVQAEEMDVAVRCFTTVRTLTTTMIDLIVAATHRISHNRIHHIGRHISLSRDMVATILALDHHQIIAEQHTTVLLSVEVPQVEAGHLLQIRNITHTAPAEAAVMDRAMGVFVEITGATAAMGAMAVAQPDEEAMEVTVAMGDKQPMATAAAEARTTTSGVEVGAGINTDVLIRELNSYIAIMNMYKRPILDLSRMCPYYRSWFNALY